ncbi:MAG: hypothetical protein ACTSWG_03160 [Candidatus Helarchaeota archaeon]
MFKPYDAQKLLDDIKIISKSVNIARKENNPENKNYAFGLTENLLNRLANDIQEMTEGFVQPDKYDGTGKIK